MGDEMTDIVERLRARPRLNAPTWAELMFEAADEIETLRQQRDELVQHLENLIDCTGAYGGRYAGARAALAKVKGGA